MERIDVDVAVIGAGTAGLAAYRAARAQGKRAVIIEGGPFGTTCARVGCMPSKLLLAAAEAAHAVERWDEFGLRGASALEIDGRAVLARVRRERDRFVGFVLAGVDAIPPQDKISGHARFVDDRTLSVGDSLHVQFGSAVIATGSSPAVPPPLRGLGARLSINDDVFGWEDLPKSVAVFGPGVIGLELGQALSRLGVRVYVFGVDGTVGPFTDPLVRDYALRSFRREFELHPKVALQSAIVTDTGVALSWEDGDSQHGIEVERVLSAAGRTPNLRGLGLERTSLALDARGVPEFDRNTLRCGTSRIFIAGDANNDVPLLHEAADEGRIAGENAARLPDTKPGLRRAGLAIAFTDPQIAIVGKRQRDLPHGSYVVGSVSFEDQGRSRVMLRNRGIGHVYADRRSGRLLGAEMFGPDVEHLAHLLAWSLQGELTVAQILELPFYHPVVEEGLRTALRDAAGKVEGIARAA